MGDSEKTRGELTPTKDCALGAALYPAGEVKT